MSCKPARDLPEGRHLVRVLPQTLRAEVGSETACWSVPGGWYYTDAGRARISAAVDLWQVRLDEMQTRLDSMQSRFESARPLPPHRCPDPPSHDAASFATASVCLGVGFLIGRVFPRRPRGEP